MIVHLATIGFASGALFLVGFHVIPVFAENIPHLMSDTHQSNNFQQPLKVAGDVAIDQDSDGLPDYWERKIGSEVLLKDTDGDGISDGLEVNLKKKQSLIMTEMVDPIF